MNRDRWILLFAWPIIVGAHVSIGVSKGWNEVKEAWESFGFCSTPPPGWRCSRGAGHGGSCAARHVGDEYSPERR